MVERLDQYLLFDVDPAVHVGAGDLVRHHLVAHHRQALDDHLLLDRFLLQPAVDRRLQAEQIIDPFLQSGDIPLFGERAWRAGCGDQ